MLIREVHFQSISELYEKRRRTGISLAYICVSSVHYPKRLSANLAIQTLSPPPMPYKHPTHGDGSYMVFLVSLFSVGRHRDDLTF